MPTISAMAGSRTGPTEGRFTGTQSDNTYHRAAAASSASRASTQVAPPSASFLLLPERRLGLQPVDQERRRIQRRLAMRRGGQHQHDVLARQQPADAVDHRAAEQRPAPLRLRGDPRDGAFGHRRIVLQRHRGDTLIAGVAAHRADEAADAADIGAPGGQCGEFRADVEIARSAPGSGPCASAAGHRRKERHLVAGMHQRGRLGEILVHRAAHGAPIGEGAGMAGASRSHQPGDQVARPCATPAGSATCSSDAPTRSRSQAKYRMVSGASASAMATQRGVGTVSIVPSECMIVLVPLPLGTTIAEPPPGRGGLVAAGAAIGHRRALWVW